jgi:hypothetical protein
LIVDCNRWIDINPEFKSRTPNSGDFAIKKEASNSNKFYFRRDVYWNADGHSFAAKEIYKDMKDKGWIK